MTNSEIDLYLKKKWRAGRKVGRTVYAQIGRLPKDSDPLIGVFDSVKLAEEEVELAKQYLGVSPLLTG